MKVEPHVMRVEGQPWGATPMQLVCEEYDNGEVVKRVRFDFTPSMVEEFARKCWDAQRRYAEQLRCTTSVLKGE
jgi:hypothetical protein